MMGVPFCCMGMAIGQACNDLIDSDPHMLAKAMRISQNAEVREYGCRMELALERQKARRGDESPRTGQEG